MGWLIFGLLIGVVLGGVGVVSLCAWIMDKGCEFCDNGEHLNVQDKYGHRVNCFYCPICGRRVE